MPRFMVIVPANAESEAGQMPSTEELERMTQYNEELVKAGVMLAGEGLHPTSNGARVRFEGGTTTVTDGPFTEAKELIGGYWIIQAKSKEEAVEWAKRCPMDDGNVIEIRQIAELEDFPEDVQAVGQLSEEPPNQATPR
ncbi:MAG TPA: YciI family protein [Baekduia sp.]|nr:YciI family protein [Baekduia sp.]